MSDPQIDPAGNTQAFRAFAHQQDSEAAQSRPSRTPMWIALAVGIVVVLGVLVYLVTTK